MDCPGGCCKNGMCCRNGTCSRAPKIGPLQMGQPAPDWSSGGNKNTSGMECKNGMCHRVSRKQYWENDPTQQNNGNKMWPGANPKQFWETSTPHHQGGDKRPRSARNNFRESQSPQQYNERGAEAYWNQHNRNNRIPNEPRNQYWGTESQQYGRMVPQAWEVESGMMFRNANTNTEQTQNWLYDTSQKGNKQQYDGEGNYTNAPYWQYGGSDRTQASYYDDSGTCPALRHNNSSGMAGALQWNIA